MRYISFCRSFDMYVLHLNFWFQDLHLHVLIRFTTRRVRESVSLLGQSKNDGQTLDQFEIQIHII